MDWTLGTENRAAVEKGGNHNEAQTWVHGILLNFPVLTKGSLQVGAKIRRDWVKSTGGPPKPSLQFSYKLKIFPK